MSGSAQYQAARLYAQLGLAVIPMNGKRPRIEWEEISGDAPPSEEQVNQWWRRWIGTSVGVIVGTRFAVLDVDVREGFNGWDSLHEIEREHEVLPDTWRSLSPSDGGHVWFSVAEGVSVVTTTLAPGVQLRIGRHVMAMPPAHKRHWEFDPEETELAPLPGWLATLAQAKTAGCERLEIPERIPVGERHDTYIKIAASLRRKGLRYDAILATLVETDRTQAERVPGHEITRQELESIAA